jgi:hypothetical protein
VKRCHVPVPCNDCPFRKVGGIRLRTARIVELADKGGAFPCHKTVDNDARDPRSELDCAGAWIFMFKIGASNQMARISERLGLVDRELHDGEHPAIFDTLAEMLATADDRHGRKEPSRRTRARKPRP